MDSTLDQLLRWKNPRYPDPGGVAYLSRRVSAYDPVRLHPPGWTDLRYSDPGGVAYLSRRVSAYDPARLDPPGWVEPANPDLEHGAGYVRRSFVPWPWARLHPPGVLWSAWPFELPPEWDPRPRRKRRAR